MKEESCTCINRSGKISATGKHKEEGKLERGESKKKGKPHDRIRKKEVKGNKKEMEISLEYHHMNLNLNFNLPVSVYHRCVQAVIATLLESLFALFFSVLSAQA
jgi:hypothetical protein